MPERRKIYFVSDVHLGTAALQNKREHENNFARWLDFIKDDVAELYLLGDIFDFWYEYRKVVPRGFTRILGRIANITDMGIPVHFFTGNHDVWVFDYLPSETGVVLHRNEYVTEICGKKFFMAHGNGFDKSDKGDRLLKKIFTNRALQLFFSRLHPNFAFYIAHKWSNASYQAKIGAKEDFNINNEGMYKFAECYLQNNYIDYFIFGHRHQMANEKIGSNSSFILLGDWIKYNSYGVFDGNNFELKFF